MRYTFFVLHFRRLTMCTLDDYTVGEPIATYLPAITGHLVEKRPHTRLDGTPSGILLWRIRCTEPGCAEQLECTSGIQKIAISPVRCPAHKLTPAQCLSRARQKSKETVHATKRAAKAAERGRKAAEKAAAKEAKCAAFEGMRGVRANPLGHPRRKISDEDVAEIRRLSAEGLSSKDLAVIFPVADSTIRSILLGNRRAG